MARFTNRTVEIAFEQAVEVGADPVWTLSGGGTHNEGLAFTFTLACNSTGVTYLPGEQINVTFVSQATPSPVGTWVTDISAMLTAAVQTLNTAHPGAATFGGINSIIFNMTVFGPVGTIALVRNSINRSEAQGDVSGSLIMPTVGRGTISAGTANWTITDTFVGTNPDLSDFTLNTASVMGGSKTVTIPFGAAGPIGIAGFPNNTLIGTVSGVVGTLNSVDFATGGNPNNYFKLVGNSLYSNGLLGFEFADLNTLSVVASAWAGRRNYYVTLKGLGPNSSEKTVQFKIRPRFSIIQPTGGTLPPVDGTSPNMVTTYGAWASFISSSTSGRQLKISPTLVGTTFPSGSNGNGNWFGAPGSVATSNVTIVGHNRISGNRGGQWYSQRGNNHLIQHLALRPGGDLVGQYFGDRDTMQLDNATNVLFEHCAFTWAIDELVQCLGVFGQPRHLRFSRCIFHLSLVRAGHPSGSHSFGALSVRCMDSVFDKCLFLGCAQRSPQFGSVSGGLVQNCVIARFGGNSTNGGTNAAVVGASFAHPIDYRNSEAFECTAIVWGNLYQDTSPLPPSPLYKSVNFGDRKWPITYENAIGTGQFGSKIFIPEGTTYDNHFFRNDAGTLDFTADPLTRANNINVTEWAAFVPSPELKVDYLPFETDMESIRMPTGTLAQRQALFNDVMNNVGPHWNGVASTLSAGILGTSYLEWEDINTWMTTGQSRTDFGQFPLQKAAVPRINSHAYVVDDAIFVPGNANHVFFCTTAGTSAASVPPEYVAATVINIPVTPILITDGTAVFRVLRLKSSGTPADEFGNTGNLPQPATATYDWAKCSMLPPGAPAWPV